MCKKPICLISILVTLAIVGDAAAQLDAASVSDGHVYLFENVGTDVQDDSANSHTANLVGSPQVVDGLKGKALKFNGVDDGVHIPDSTAMNLSTNQNRTVIAIFNCADVSKSEKQVVYEEGGTTRGLTIYVHEGLVYAGGWNLSDYTPEWTGTHLSAPVASNVWYSVAMVVRDAGPAQEPDKFEMWMSGELIDVGPGGQLNSRSNDCGIGYRNSESKFHDGNATGGGSYFEGIIDDVWVLSNAALTQEELRGFAAEVWPFAFSPDPPDGGFLMGTWGNLLWAPGGYAVTHDVYAGENFDDVNNGVADTFIGNQANTDLIVGFPGFPFSDGLTPGTTYYWRVDEVNDANADSPWKGEVWSFSVPPRTAYLPVPADEGEAVPLDVQLTWAPGFEAKLHTVYFGDNFDDVNNAAGGMLLGDPFFTPPGPLEMAKTYYWRVDEFDPPMTYRGAVWSFRTEGTAFDPTPAKGAVEVSPSPVLKWAAGGLAASHEVYLGADADAVANAGKASPQFKGGQPVGQETYIADGLALMTTYYWRVDEVNATETGSPWIGNVWSFTTGDFLSVDDFEAYNDIDPPDPASYRIFDKWIDGYGTLDNGALVGNALPPYAEQTIVHGDDQSMNYAYDNTGKTSEATLTLVYPKDWTVEGVTKLSLWFRGSTANAADRAYVALNGTAVVYHDDPAATQLFGWNEWVIDLGTFGVNLSNVNSITIGVGTKNAPSPTGGTGTLYFDDIRLIK